LDSLLIRNRRFICTVNIPTREVAGGGFSLTVIAGFKLDFEGARFRLSLLQAAAISACLGKELRQRLLSGFVVEATFSACVVIREAGTGIVLGYEF
jgi:hypothetical protein